MERLDDYLREKRAEVEKHLEAALRPEPGLPASLLEAMRYSLLTAGKRLRPILVVMAAEASVIDRRDTGPTNNPWPAACAVEMIHTYSLIHDDLPAMDDDDLRRGQPTCHKKFGEALAILAGDALLTKAFQVLAEGYPAIAASSCCRELARAAGAAGMVGGQVDDLAWEQASERNVEGLEYLHLRKTGALIQASLRLGALAAYAHQNSPPPPQLLERLDGYGRCLGLAFQIVDDLLDVEGHAEKTGKRVGKDAVRGKLTYPGFLGVAESRRRAERLGREAREHIQPLGDAASRLLALVSRVLDRDR
ncbi:MAG TPA: farnesyl diphosphate synthase [Gemmataceae bacterium]|nr:farnesyl diphosphate synthase [Gemmataceae bacterium]